jgi:hypothetical protein
MNNRAISAGASLTPWSSGLFIAGLLAVALSTFSPAAAAVESKLTKEDEACLKCHDHEVGKERLEKTLGDGKTLSLDISTRAYIESMHNGTSCEDCHDSIDGKTHGKQKTALKSRRELSLAMQQSCVTCHKKKVKLYDDGIHAAMVKQGSDKAPLCSDCHSPHTLRSVKIITPIDQVPCAKCHDAIFKAYAQDVHGLERIARGKTAPICADCHKAHAVKAASLGTTVRDACLSCHETAVAQHKEWLPNTLRHFEAISCPVCHNPNARRRVNLRLVDQATGLQVQEKLGVPQFERLTQQADAKQLGLDERALWSLLNEFSQSDKPVSTVLRGRLEVMSGVEAHQISDKEHAIKDCNTCHRAGASAFQSVSLTIADPDGQPLRHAVQKDVLTSLLATQSIRGFYAIGSTRIQWLDILLVLVVIGACCVPLAHMGANRLFKNFRERQAALHRELLQAEQSATAPSASKPNPTEP